MTTKKQRRAAVEAKHEKWLAERRESGLKAQRADQAKRDAKLRQSAQSTHDKKKHSPKKTDKDCIICQEMIATKNAQEIEQEREAYASG